MSGENQVEGRNPVIEVLKSGREIEKIILSKGSNQGSIKKIIGMAKSKKVLVQYVDKSNLDSLSETGNHQGVIALVSAHEYKSIDYILKSAEEKGEAPFVIILDEIEDPHNLGAIMRTAECAGVHGVIIPKRRSVGLTSTVAKTSAGAIEYMPVAKVTNISNAIEELKERGLWIYGADMDGDEDYFKKDLKGPIGIVVGNEGKGISRLVKEKCDFLVKIPMKGKVSSLNASVATSIITYEVLRQRS
ncbi:23S rRNA (guanosine(2251)-2'-O)-methyltransferase RlmB [Sporosalibacterium faouarense]|uniref:23S rRNA (guanosine(2251)-2'-O)-methyltransferase RlmB n=1 Tax=Sporosalibacterium faouarense TaxID=516123 RepID=UPI00141CD6C0|nr:23S rRNA (guanosine(2251)-2'-O)-methyltransferase RlmB [Sporosalibacterium faouarense]MTI48356.1 23S rRNA (guanosine(2251)-2'-O)-methyltransferase RlmB [Bacillota bacterium]